jgi:hypothetical protein
MAARESEVFNGLTSDSYQTYADFFEPQVIPEVKRRYGKGIQLIDMFGKYLTGRMRPVEADTWDGWEEEKPRRAINVHASGSGAAKSAGVAQTIKLAAADISTTTYKYYPKIGMHVICIGTNGEEVLTRIDDISASTTTVVLTVIPFDSTLALADQSSKQLPIVGYSKPNGTGQPAPTGTGYVKRSFTSQIFADTIQCDGVQLATTTYFDKGSTDPKFWSDAYMLAEMRMDDYIEGAILHGQPNANTSLLIGKDHNITDGVTRTEGLGNIIGTIKGIQYWNSALGSSVDWDESGGFELADLNEVSDKLRAEGITSGTILVPCGHKLQRSVDAWGLTLATDSPQLINTISSHFGNTNDFSVSLGFKVVRVDGLVYIFQVLDAFSNPDYLGVTSLNYANLGYAFPLSNVSVSDAYGSKVMVPNMSLRTRAKGSYNRGVREIWTEGAAGGNTGSYQGDVDTKKVYMRQHLGFELFAANQIVKLNPA